MTQGRIAAVFLLSVFLGLATFSLTHAQTASEAPSANNANKECPNVDATHGYTTTVSYDAEYKDGTVTKRNLNNKLCPTDVKGISGPVQVQGQCKAPNDCKAMGYFDTDGKFHYLPVNPADGPKLQGVTVEPGNGQPTNPTNPSTQPDTTSAPQPTPETNQSKLPTNNYNDTPSTGNTNSTPLNSGSISNARSILDSLSTGGTGGYSPWNGVTPDLSSTPNFEQPGGSSFWNGTVPDLSSGGSNPYLDLNPTVLGEPTTNISSEPTTPDATPSDRSYTQPGSEGTFNNPNATPQTVEFKASPDANPSSPGSSGFPSDNNPTNNVPENTFKSPTTEIANTGLGNSPQNFPQNLSQVPSLNPTQVPDFYIRPTNPDTVGLNPIPTNPTASVWDLPKGDWKPNVYTPQGNPDINAQLAQFANSPDQIKTAPGDISQATSQNQFQPANRDFGSVGPLTIGNGAPPIWGLGGGEHINWTVTPTNIGQAYIVAGPDLNGGFWPTMDQVVAAQAQLREEFAAREVPSTDLVPVVEQNPADKLAQAPSAQETFTQPTSSCPNSDWSCWAKGVGNSVMSGSIFSMSAEAKPVGQSFDVTAYYPCTSGSACPVQGGLDSAKPGLDGQSLVRTLDNYRTGKSDFVTGASDPSRYGQTYEIPSLTYKSIQDGKMYTLENVPVYIHDTGSAFNGRPDKIDIATGVVNSESEARQAAAQQPFLNDRYQSYANITGQDLSARSGGNVIPENTYVRDTVPEVLSGGPSVDSIKDINFNGFSRLASVETGGSLADITPNQDISIPKPEWNPLSEQDIEQIRSQGIKEAETAQLADRYAQADAEAQLVKDAADKQLARDAAVQAENKAGQEAQRVDRLAQADAEAAKVAQDAQTAKDQSALLAKNDQTDTLLAKDAADKKLAVEQSILFAKNSDLEAKLSAQQQIDANVPLPDTSSVVNIPTQKDAWAELLKTSGQSTAPATYDGYYDAAGIPKTPEPMSDAKIAELAKGQGDLIAQNNQTETQLAKDAADAQSAQLAKDAATQADNQAGQDAQRADRLAQADADAAQAAKDQAAAQTKNPESAPTKIIADVLKGDFKSAWDTFINSGAAVQPITTASAQPESSDTSVKSATSGAQPLSDAEIAARIPAPDTGTVAKGLNDPRVQTVFDQKIADANAQVKYFQDLVDRTDNPTAKAIAQTALDDSNKRLDVIVGNSISYSAGNPSPELQKAIEQADQGQGAIAKALMVNADQGASLAKTLSSSMNLNDMSLGDVAKGVGWMAAETWSMTNSAVANLGGKAGIPGFGADPTTAIGNAVDPLGSEYHTVADVAALAPFAIGPVKSLGAKLGDVAFGESISTTGGSVAADVVASDVRVIARDSAGFPTVAEQGVRTVADVVPQNAGDAGLNAARELGAVRTVPTDVTVPSAGAAEVSTGVKTVDAVAADIKTSIPKAEPGPDALNAVASDINSGVKTVPKPVESLGEIPKSGTVFDTPAPQSFLSRTTENVKLAFNDVKTTVSDTYDSWFGTKAVEPSTSATPEVVAARVEPVGGNAPDVVASRVEPTAGTPDTGLTATRAEPTTANPASDLNIKPSLATQPEVAPTTAAVEKSWYQKAYDYVLGEKESPTVTESVKSQTAILGADAPPIGKDFNIPGPAKVDAASVEGGAANTKVPIQDVAIPGSDAPPIVRSINIPGASKLDAVSVEGGAADATRAVPEKVVTPGEKVPVTDARPTAAGETPGSAADRPVAARAAATDGAAPAAVEEKSASTLKTVAQSAYDGTKAVLSSCWGNKLVCAGIVGGAAGLAYYNIPSSWLPGATPAVPPTNPSAPAAPDTSVAPGAKPAPSPSEDPSKNPRTPGTPEAPPGKAQAEQTNTNNSSGILSGLSSFLRGFLSGFTGAGSAFPGAPVPTTAPAVNTVAPSATPMVTPVITPTVTPTATSSGTTTPIVSSVSFIANPSSVSSGDTSRLSWTAIGLSACTITAPDASVVTSGSYQGSFTTAALSTTTLFGITCSGTAGSATSSVSVTVK